MARAVLKLKGFTFTTLAYALNYVGNFKGIGKVYGQVFIDSYSRVADVKRYEDKTALRSADLLNDRVLPWYQEQEVPLLRLLTDRGSEYKGKLENHAYALFLSVEGITIPRGKRIHHRRMACVRVFIRR